MAKEVIIKAAVSASQIASVMKMVGDDTFISGRITGIGKQLKAVRENITHSCAAIVIHAAKHSTSKYANALIAVLVEEKQKADAEAVINWFEGNGFVKAKHPETGKMQLAFVPTIMEATLAEFDADNVATVTKLLEKPYHLAIAKVDPYTDFTLRQKIAALIKEAKGKQANVELRTKAGVKTDLVGLGELEGIAARFNQQSPPVNADGATIQ